MQPRRHRMRRQARRESSRAWIASGATVTIKTRPYLVVGYTPGRAPYGLYRDEMDDDYLTGMITPDSPGKLSDLDLSGP